MAIPLNSKRPVRELLGERLTMTIVLALATLIVTWAIGIPLGVYSATHQYSLADQIISVISFIGLGIPGFLLALLVLYFAIVTMGMEATGLFSAGICECAMECGYAWSI